MKNVKYFSIIGIMAMGILIPIGITDAAPSEVGTVFNIVISNPHPTDFSNFVIDDFVIWYAENNPGDSVSVTNDARAGSSDAPNDILAANGTSPSMDILWGGGRFNFNILRDNAGINLLQPYRVAEHNNFSAFLGGWDLWDSDATGCDATSCTTDPSWYAAAISGFGFMWNTEVLATNNLPTPSTWQDLTSYDYFGEIVMANPAASGSTTASVLQLLQFFSDQHSLSTINDSADSTEAWEIWAQIAGNVGEFTTSSSIVPTKVAAGDFAIGIVIDFFAYSRMDGFPVGFSYGGATTVSPDPVAIVLNGPNAGDDTAEQFVDYVTSTRGQSRVGKFRTPANRNATSIFPVPNAFTSLGNPSNAFPAITPFDPNLDGRMFSEARSLFDNWFVQNTVKQTAAWMAIGTSTNSVAKAEALVLYTKLPSNFDGTIAGLDALDQNNVTQTALWLSEGAANFDAAKAKAEEPVTTTPPTTATVTGTETVTETISSAPGFGLLLLLVSIAVMVVIRQKKK